MGTSIKLPGGSTGALTTASDSDTETITQAGSGGVPSFITSNRTMTINHNFTESFQIPVVNTTVTCPWNWTVATGKTLTLTSVGSTSAQKYVFSGLFTTAGTGKVVVGGGGNGTLTSLSAASGITDLTLANNTNHITEVGAGAIAATGATIRFAGSQQVLRWATGNTTDYSSSAYTKVFSGLGFSPDPNGQTITFASVWSPSPSSVQMGNPIAARQVNGGRLKFNANQVVTRAFWYVFAGTVMELNGAFTGAFGSNEVGNGGGTSASMIAGIEGTGSTEQTWQVNNTAYCYGAGGTTGTNGVLTVANWSYIGANSEMWVYSDGTANNCSKVHSNGTWGNANQKIRLKNAMAAGTYTIGSSTGTMSGTAPTAANVIENLSGRTVSAITQVGNALQMVLV